MVSEKKLGNKNSEQAQNSRSISSIKGIRSSLPAQED